MRGKGGCEEKVDRERKGTRRECHAYNTVQGGFVQGPPFEIRQYMNGNDFAQVRYQQLILFTSLVIHNKNANMILHIMNSTMSSGSLVLLLIGC